MVPAAAPDATPMTVQERRQLLSAAAVQNLA